MCFFLNKNKTKHFAYLFLTTGSQNIKAALHETQTKLKELKDAVRH